MLPRWYNILLLKAGLRDELRILIQPQRLVMLRLNRKFGNETIIDRHDIALTSTEDAHDAGLKPMFQDMWRPAISALRSALSDPRWQQAIPTIVLSSHFVRYALIPWNAELTNAAERNAYLRHCFTLAYGEAAMSWDLRLSPAGFGQSAIASGIDMSMLEAIRIELEQVGLPIQNIHPNLMLAVNETRAYLGKEGAGMSLCFVSKEPGRLCIGLVEKGQWRSLKSVVAETDISAQLQALIQRESIMTGLDTVHWPVVIHCLGTEDTGQVSLYGRKVKTVPAMTVFVSGTGMYKRAA